jgi:hemerythrin-like domain-containing protein
MGPTDELTKEHDAIGVVLDILEVIAGQMDAGQDYEADHLDQILGFASIFIDRCHHGKEEDYLFPAMESSLGAKKEWLVPDLLREHALSRDYVKQMKEHLASAAAAHSVASFVENAGKYVDLLRQHIYKENNLLLAEAAQQLSEDRQRAMAEDFRVLEEKRIGVGKHEQFHQMLESLQGTYLRK